MPVLAGIDPPFKIPIKNPQTSLRYQMAISQTKNGDPRHGNMQIRGHDDTLNPKTLNPNQQGGLRRVVAKNSHWGALLSGYHRGQNRSKNYIFTMVTPGLAGELFAPRYYNPQYKDSHKRPLLGGS